jgi:hypothetical protein
VSDPAADHAVAANDENVLIHASSFRWRQGCPDGRRVT